MLKHFALASILALQVPWQGQHEYGAYNIVVLESGTGEISVADTTSSGFTGGRVDIVAMLDVDTLTLADGDDEVDFYFQTTYDGSNWCDLENIHYDNSDNGSTALLAVRLGPWGTISSADKGATCTDATLADDTKNAWPVGENVRVKVTITGATAPSYEYAATMFLR